MSSICDGVTVGFKLDICLRISVNCLIWVANCTYLSTVAVKRGILIVLFYGLGIEIYSAGPVMLRKGLIAFQLQRGGGINVGSDGHDGDLEC
jgi:hypothetical protein